MPGGCPYKSAAVLVVGGVPPGAPVAAVAPGGKPGAWLRTANGSWLVPGLGVPGEAKGS